MRIVRALSLRGRSERVRRAVWIVGVLAVGLVIGGYVFFSGERKALIRYRTAPVDRGTVVSVVTATGTINPVVSVQEASQVTGKMQSLHADFNSIVKAGEDVVLIDPAVYDAKRDQAEYNLAHARASVT